MALDMPATNGTATHTLLVSSMDQTRDQSFQDLVQQFKQAGQDVRTEMCDRIIDGGA